MPIDGIKKDPESRERSREQGEFGYHIIEAGVNGHGAGNGLQPAGFKYSWICAVGGDAVVQHTNEYGVDTASRTFSAGENFDKGSWVPGLFSGINVTTGKIRACIAYESAQV